MKIGIFIEPKNENLKTIKIWKKIIKKNFKYHKYLNHPPHLTVAVFDFKKKIPIKNFKNLLKEIPQKKFNIKFLKPSIFYNDPITKCDTLHFTVKKDKELINLQKHIFKKFKKFDEFIKRKKKFNNKKFNINLKKFGYPFVGKEWLPHFTIASLKGDVKMKNSILSKFLKQKITKKFLRVDNVSLWKINREKHDKLLKINLL